MKNGIPAFVRTRYRAATARERLARHIFFDPAGGLAIRLFGQSSSLLSPDAIAVIAVSILFPVAARGREMAMKNEDRAALSEASYRGATVRERLAAVTVFRTCRTKPYISDER